MARMAKRRVTFEVDQVELFDTLHKMGGNMGPIGERVVATLLVENDSFADAIGMALYGITVVSSETLTEATEETSA